MVDYEMTAAEELRLAWWMVRGDAVTADEFYRHTSILISRASELDQEELNELAGLVSKPFRRPRGRTMDRERELWVWATCFTSFNAQRRIPTKPEALAMITARYGKHITSDMVDRLYRRVQKNGPP